MSANRVRAVFIELVSQVPPEQWEQRLAELAREDQELRAKVAALLAAHRKADSFLEEPAVPLRATGDLDPAANGPAGAASQERPGTTIGPYKLLELIGEGGMGNVWMAEQREPMQRKVALKIIKEGMDTRQVVARFEAERQALALMDHPNIAKVFDGGTLNGERGHVSAPSAPGAHATRLATDATRLAGRPYFVMELVKGTPITTYCDEHRLTPRERLELFLPVCQAIQHAHQKGIIHRDIKPANVLVAPYDGRPVPKVIDFGVAKAVGQRLTERTLFTGFGAVVGTLEYMSPEQAELNNQDIDTRSDIYALGVLLYELLTGTTPLSHERLKQAAFTETLRLIREEDPPKPSTRLSELSRPRAPREGCVTRSVTATLASVAALRHTEPARLTKELRGELDWIVMKALEKNRNRRYETANSLATDVAHYLADEPVQACPPTVAYRFSKFARRNKGPMAAVSLVLLALTAGIIGTTSGLVRTQQARQAETQRAEGERQAKQEALAAAQAEQKAKEAAQTREGETRAVLDFVENKIFAAARPEIVEGGLGREVTLRKALEAALPVVGKSFPDQPLIEARLRYTLAKSFAQLGDAKSALGQLEAAQTLYDKHSAPDHPDRLRCATLLAASYDFLGRPVEAVKIHEETLALQKARLGRDHADTLKSMHHLAETYAALGRHAEALKLREEALVLRKAKHGPEHRETLRCMHDLANSYEALGRFADALKLHEETLTLQKAKFGLDDRDTLFSMHEIACCYQVLGRLADARKLQEQAVAIKKAKLGLDHPETIAGIWHLGLILFDQGHHADALRLHEEALALSKARLGVDHARTLGCMNTLAANYLTVGRDADALKLLDESLKRVEGKVVDPGLIGQVLCVRLRYFAKTRDAAGCRATAEMYEKLKRTESENLYEAAGMRAVTAAVIRGTDSKSVLRAKEATAEADRAMAWLNQAVAAGYKDTAHMKEDKDLDALRDREDFQKLLAELKVGKEKKN
jgi:serine/threonine protein kinase/tetratricopeptide (TPR) repeat protein